MLVADPLERRVLGIEMLSVNRFHRRIIAESFLSAYGLFSQREAVVDI